MRRTQVAAEPRVHLIGYGPSQSTVGANRAGRDAVVALTKHLDAAHGLTASAPTSDLSDLAPAAQARPLVS